MTTEVKKSTVILCIGMAGSGKTTFMQRVNTYLHGQKNAPYAINLDPAVNSLTYSPNIDIRDTIDYKEVMEHYNLGPNGAILTSLNLFTTKFDQVLELIDKKEDSLEYILVDTPGQIEIFTWSASGAIVTEALAVTHPTVIAYIIDTPRTTRPATFMSNMLYACSILYKTKLPFIIVFNKTDLQDHQFAKEWMEDFEAFQKALANDTTYMASFMHSMCLVLDEFYSHLRAVGVSAATGDGMEDFFKAVDDAKDEYYKEYHPELMRKVAEKTKNETLRREEELTKLVADLSIDGLGKDLKPRFDPNHPDNGTHIPYAE